MPVFFCWLLVKKLISQKTLLGVVISANENWLALLFQDSLVLCSVKCKGWPFGTILVWRLGPRARALRRCCLDSFWARARAPTRTWSDQTTQRKACGSFSANTNDKRQKTRLLAFVPPPHRFLSFFLFFFLSPFLSFSFFLFLSFFVFFSLFLSFFGFFVSLILCFFVSLILCFFVSLFVCFFVRWCLLCWLLACLLLCLFTRKESRGATYD